MAQIRSPESSAIPDTASRVDTCDGALFGADVAALRLAQRAALDVLDRIALTVNDYLALGLDGRAVSLSVLGPPVNKGSGWMGALLLVAGRTDGAEPGSMVERPQRSEDERP